MVGGSEGDNSGVVLSTIERVEELTEEWVGTGTTVKATEGVEVLNDDDGGRKGTGVSVDLGEGAPRGDIVGGDIEHGGVTTIVESRLAEGGLSGAGWACEKNTTAGGEIHISKIVKMGEEIKNMEIKGGAGVSIEDDIVETKVWVDIEELKVNVDHGPLDGALGVEPGLYEFIEVARLAIICSTVNIETVRTVGVAVNIDDIVTAGGIVSDEEISADVDIHRVVRADIHRLGGGGDLAAELVETGCTVESAIVANNVADGMEDELTVTRSILGLELGNTPVGTEKIHGSAEARAVGVIVCIPSAVNCADKAGKVVDRKIPKRGAEGCVIIIVIHINSLLDLSIARIVSVSKGCCT